jgi:hypothetical protein
MLQAHLLEISKKTSITSKMYCYLEAKKNVCLNDFFKKL